MLLPRRRTLAMDRPLVILAIVFGGLACAGAMVVAGVLFVMFTVVTSAGQDLASGDANSGIQRKQFEAAAKEADRNRRKQEPVNEAQHSLALLEEADETDLMRVAKWLKHNRMAGFLPTPPEALGEAVQECQNLQSCGQIKYCNKIASDWSRSIKSAKENQQRRRDGERRAAISR
jgi:hypothetical protein